MGELADRLEQAVAGGAGGEVGDDQRLLGERPEELRHVVGDERLGGDGGGGAPTTEKAASEHPQTVQAGPLARGEQAVAPVEEGFERALALGHRRVMAAEDLEPIVEPVEQLLRARSRSSHGGSQLEGERQPVELSADLGHDGRHRRVGERRPRRPGDPIEEQGHRRGWAAPGATTSNGSTPPQLLAGSAEGTRLVASTPHAGAPTTSSSRSRAQAAATLSQLSTMRSASLWARCSSTSVQRSSPRLGTPSASLDDGRR